MVNAGPGRGGWPRSVPRSPVSAHRGPGDLPEDHDPADDGEIDEVQRSALRHETRCAIFETVARTPGLNKRQVGHRVGVNRSTAHHHLARLEAYELVELLPGERDNEVLCFHRDHVELWEDERTRLLYGQPPARRVALYVHANAGATTGELETALDAAPRTIRDHLAELRDRDLVEAHRFRRRVEYHPTHLLEAWADEVGDCYRRPWIE